MARMRLPQPFSRRNGLALLCRTQKMHLHRAHRTKRRQPDEDIWKTKLCTTIITGKRRMLAISIRDHPSGYFTTVHMGHSNRSVFDSITGMLRKPRHPHTCYQRDAREEAGNQNHPHRLRHGRRKLMTMGHKADKEQDRRKFSSNITPTIDIVIMQSDSCYLLALSHSRCVSILSTPKCRNILMRYCLVYRDDFCSSIALSRGHNRRSEANLITLNNPTS